MLKVILRASAIVIISAIGLLTSPTFEYKSTALEAYEEPVLVNKISKPGVILASLTASSDNRAVRLQSFFASKNSPFTPYTKDFVRIADENGLDWRLLPAIALLESGLGRQVPSGSYNPYGWNNGRYIFRDWVNATEFVAKQIVAKWSKYGPITPQSIGPYYAESPTWSARVSLYMSQISRY